MADRGWDRQFDDPIPLPRGRQLVTLQDAGTFITKLPKVEHDTAEWQAPTASGFTLRLHRAIMGHVSPPAKDHV
jgi:hypothetical protein